jgi:glycosyltransferase involved in cell wall biosynthesis
MRILFVAPADSIRVAHWINQVSEQTGWDIHLFPVNSSALPHRNLRNLAVYGLSHFREQRPLRNVRWIKGLWPWPRGTGRVVKLIRRFRPEVWDNYSWLDRIVRRLKPDIVHSLGLPEAGYTAYMAWTKFQDGFPPWIATDWAGQLPLFAPFTWQRLLATQVFANCNYYFGQCEQDLQTARYLGLRGQALPFFPNPPGYDLDVISSVRQEGQTSERKLIVVNGGFDFSDRTLVALRAIERAAHHLAGFRVAIFQPTYEVEVKAELLTQDTGVPTDLYRDLSHEDILRLLGAARIYIGLHVSRTVSPMFFDAMAMGALPIESQTSFAREWISDGRSGLVVLPEDPGPVAEAIYKAAVDDALVNSAAQANRRVVMERLDIHHVRPKMIAMYETVAGERSRSRPSD